MAIFWRVLEQMSILLAELEQQFPAKILMELDSGSRRSFQKAHPVVDARHQFIGFRRDDRSRANDLVASMPMLGETFIPLFEEPGLVKRFSPAYEEYQRHVPRWVPLVRPWTEEKKTQG